MPVTWGPPDGEHLGRHPKLDAWRVGDWLLEEVDDEGHVRPRRVDLALAVLRRAGILISRDYLWAMSYVARAVEPERRREALSWSHHRLVSHLPPDEQDLLLSLAEGAEWSCIELRAQLYPEAEAA